MQTATPIIASEWPTMYFVAAMTETSTPSASGLKNSGAAQVLSMMVRDAARLGDGDDRRHVLHLEGERAGALEIDEPRVGRISRSMPAPMRGS